MTIRFIIVIILSTFMFSCLRNRLLNNDDCKSYFDIVATEWLKSEKGIYSYKNHPKYWPPYSDFFRGTCLEGMSKRQVINLFGTPSKSFFFGDKEIMIYCTTEKCLTGGIERNRGLNVVIDISIKQVSEAYHSPYLVE